MNFSHYKGLIDSDSVQRFVFSQGNRPAAEGRDGSLTYLSEAFLFDEDMASIIEEINLCKDSSDSDFFILDGKKYSFQKLQLKDSSQVFVYPENKEEINWNDLLIPGYISDWVESRSGILIFYGSDEAFVEKVRLAFAKKRAEVSRGTSLIFVGSEVESHVSNEGHFLLTSKDEEGFLNQKSNVQFDFYSFKSDSSVVGLKKTLQLADKGSLILTNSYWGDAAKVWAEVYECFSVQSLREFFFESTIGFVGVKQAESKNLGSEVIFEAFPVPKHEGLLDLKMNEQLSLLKKHIQKEGVSFNQSLHSLVLKRKITLDSAYKISSDPEELNTFLSQSGI